jgi:hypothetical protein
MGEILTTWTPLIERFGMPAAMLVGFLWLIIAGKLVPERSVAQLAAAYQLECERNARCQEKLLSVLEMAAQQSKATVDVLAARRR